MNAHLHKLGALLRMLGRSGIELAPHPSDPTRLRHRPAPLPLGMREPLLNHRAAVLGLLVSDYTPRSQDGAHALGERLGMADDLGMPTHPGAPAWLIAVGEAMNLDAQTCAVSQVEA